MTPCLICLGETAPDSRDGSYHRACLRGLFGVDELPRADIDPTTLPDHRGAGARGWSISGVQRKAKLRLDPARRELLLVDGGEPSTLILKPSIERFPDVPENEHLSMVIGRLAGLEIPPCGLLRLADGALAFVIKRFDRTDAAPPQRLRQEDLAVLAGRRPEDKEQGSAELCAELLARHVDDPAASLRRLFRLFVVSYWLGNGDLHLKNISVLEPEGGRGFTLSPVYDLLSTQIYDTRHTPQLLRVSGHRDGALSRRHYLEFAVGPCGIPEAEAAAIMCDILAAHDQARAALARSPLPDKLKVKYADSLERRAKMLPGNHGPR